MAQAYHPSYSGGRDWEDHSSRPAGAKSLQGPISTAGYGGMYLSCQLCSEAQIGRSWSRLASA
jgi:hypothetical protein